MRLGRVTNLVAACFVFSLTAFAADDRIETRDTNNDGKTDMWKYYSKNTLDISARDTNGDGKPDNFQKFLQGRQLVLKEWDRNFDGKIDRRTLVEWSMIRHTPGLPEIPGYRPIWKEEDGNYDGLVDEYYQRGHKNAGASRIGKPIDGAPAKRGTGEEKKETGRAEALVETMNERYGASR